MVLDLYNLNKSGLCVSTEAITRFQMSIIICSAYICLLTFMVSLCLNA